MGVKVRPVETCSRGYGDNFVGNRHGRAIELIQSTLIMALLADLST